MYANLLPASDANVETYRGYIVAALLDKLDLLGHKLYRCRK